jgi:hypothetical protein
MLLRSTSSFYFLAIWAIGGVKALNAAYAIYSQYGRKRGTCVDTIFQRQKPKDHHITSSDIFNSEKTRKRSVRSHCRLKYAIISI